MTGFPCALHDQLERGEEEGGVCSSAQLVHKTCFSALKV